MAKIELVSPLKVPVTKSRYFTLNLNQYRNTHYQTLNKAKHVYKELMSEQINNIPKITQVESIEYMLYPASKRLTDLDNVCSIHAKFLQDVLVELNKLPEDNYTVIWNMRFLIGRVDKDNPRVNVYISGETE